MRGISQPTKSSLDASVTAHLTNYEWNNNATRNSTCMHECNEEPECNKETTLNACMRSRRTYACMQCAMRKNVCMQLKNKTTSMQKNKHTSIHALSNETRRSECRDGRLLVLALFLFCEYQIFHTASMQVRVRVLKLQNASTSTSTEISKCEYEYE